MGEAASWQVWYVCKRSSSADAAYNVKVNVSGIADNPDVLPMCFLRL